jgi:hypothetical protein
MSPTRPPLVLALDSLMEKFTLMVPRSDQPFLASASSGRPGESACSQVVNNWR